MASGDRIGYLIWGGAYDGANNIGYNAAISGYASENWTAGARGTEVIIQTTDNGTTARNNRLVVRNTGNVEISRNLVISTSGYGIDFSATAGTGTSELLDDYEEGAGRLSLPMLPLAETLRVEPFMVITQKLET